MSIDSRSPAEKAYDATKLSRGPIAPAAQPEDTDAIIRVLEAVCADDELPPDIPLSQEEIALMGILTGEQRRIAQDGAQIIAAHFQKQASDAEHAWADIVRTLLP